MRTIFLWIASAAACCSAAVAQDHLEPEDSVYQGRAYQDDVLIGYDIDVVRKFEELFAGGFSARAIILPSFEPEYGVGVSSNKDDPKLVGLRADAKLWYYSILREYDSGKRPPSDRYKEKTKRLCASFALRCRPGLKTSNFYAVKCCSAPKTRPC